MEKQDHYFKPEDYRTVSHEAERTEKWNNILGIISLLSGKPGFYSGKLLKSDGVKLTGYFIHVQIRGVVYRGWAGACPFQPGDEIEMAVEWQEDHYELYAIARPKDSMISVCPTCNIGRIAYYKTFCLVMLLFFSLMNVFIFGLNTIVSFSSGLNFIFIMLVIDFEKCCRVASNACRGIW